MGSLQIFPVTKPMMMVDATTYLSRHKEWHILTQAQALKQFQNEYTTKKQPTTKSHKLASTDLC